VALAEAGAELVGAVLMDRLGPFSQETLPGGTEGSGRRVVLTFYPETAGLPPATADDVRALLPREVTGSAGILVETDEVARDWEDGWKAHFRPIVVGGVRIRPPWEPVVDDDRIDVAINPGMGFGTGLHPTTRGTLGLLQSGGEGRGRLVDAGTGSGVLAIAAAKLGWGPIIAFDNDPVALIAAKENLEANGVQNVVRLEEADVGGADLQWFGGATVLANMTLDPVSSLIRRLAAGFAAAGAAPVRMVVSGILAGGQEEELLRLARTAGFLPGQSVYETEWVSLELLPASGEG
jgi:ribosomal protein L11 methyltransferase